MRYDIIDELGNKVDSSEFRSIAIDVAESLARKNAKVYRIQEPSGLVTYETKTGVRIYSNPERYLLVPDWPSGNERVSAMFTVETSKKGQRVSRVTTDKYGRESKPKVTTFTKQVAIVTGDDNKTYIAELSPTGIISIVQSNLKFTDEIISRDGSPERYAAVLALIRQAATIA